MSSLRVVLVALLALVFFPSRAFAQDKAELSATVEPSTVEIGSAFRYQLKASVTGSGGNAPRSPQPGTLPEGMTVAGTSSSPMHMMRIVNGVTSQVDSLTTVWTVRATKLGTFTVGPPTVEIGGARRAAKAVKITVVPVGKAPKAPPRAQDPFDPFGGSPFDFFGQGPDPLGGAPSPFDPFKDLFGGDDDPRMRGPVDKRYSLPEPRAPKAFLHAVVDKPRAVVGEQITLSVYLYSLPETQLGSAQDVHVPSAPDFTRRPLADSGPSKHLGRAIVGDRAWDVELLLKDALFPVKTGLLVIGPMSLVLTNGRIGYRESESLTVDVGEPPLAGRPPGYVVGDVGNFALQATVSPRSATRGEPIGVTIELRGTGNLPTQLALPTAPGIEWMDAQVKESIGAQREEKIGGTRTFTYVVRADKEGAVDLGEVKLPYFDPEKRAYAVARASLGIVDLAKGTPRDAGVTDDADQVAIDLPKPRMSLEGGTERTYLTERRFYRVSLFGAPLACAIAVVGSRAFRKVRERQKGRAPDPARVEKERRAEAEAAVAADDGAKAVSAVARALEAAVFARTGVNARGATGSALVSELEATGVTADAARATAEALRACEDARFSPAGVSIDDARELWTRAKSAVEGLAKRAEGA